MKKKILITGGAGFIGSHTADALSANGYAVRILDNLSPPVHNGRWPKYVLGENYELIKGDVCNKKTLSAALRGVDYVYHLAAYQDQRPDFSKFFHTNTVSSALLYEIIVEKKLPIKKVILASSQFVYGDGTYMCSHSRKPFYPEVRHLSQFKQKKWDIICPHGGRAKFSLFKENEPISPTNSYGLSKQAIEHLSLRLGKTYGIPSVLLRYSIVQGSRQSPRNLYSGALRIFVSQALAGVPITVYEDGFQTRDFVNVHDVVRANLRVLKTGKADFEIFNVGGGMAHTVKGFAELVKQITKSESKIIVGSYRRTDTRHAVSDIKKLKRLGWSPRYTPHDSIREYADWFIKEGFLRTVKRKNLAGLKKGITG